MTYTIERGIPLPEPTWRSPNGKSAAIRALQPGESFEMVGSSTPSLASAIGRRLGRKYVTKLIREGYDARGRPDVASNVHRVWRVT